MRLLTTTTCAALLLASLAQAQDAIYIGGGGDAVTYGNGTGGTDNVQYYGNVTVDGANSTTVYEADGANVLFHGVNWVNTNSPSFLNSTGATTGTGRITFNRPGLTGLSAAGQTLDGGFGSTGTQPGMLNLAIDNTLHLTLANTNARVNNGMIFTLGSVITGTNRFVLGPSATQTGYNATTNYFVTNTGTGEVRKEAIPGTWFFPIGNAVGGGSNYAPANMQVTSGTPDYYMNVSDYSFSQPDETPITGAGIPYVSRTWLIYGSSPSHVIMNFMHRSTSPPEVGGYDVTFSNLARYDYAGSWVPALSDAETNAAFGTPSGYYAQNRDYDIPTAIGSSSFYTKVNSLTILPIHLTAFTASKLGSSAAIINWEVTADVAIQSFTIERSATGQLGWQAIGSVAGATGSGSHKYTFTDRQVFASANFYRLKIIDQAGKITYTAIRLVNFGRGVAVMAYPNPASTYLLVAGVENNSTIRLTDIAGKTMLSANSSDAVTKLPIAHLSKGLYMVQVWNDGKLRASIKIVKN